MLRERVWMLVQAEKLILPKRNVFVARDVVVVPKSWDRSIVKDLSASADSAESVPTAFLSEVGSDEVEKLGRDIGD